MGWVLLGVVSLPAVGILLPIEGQTGSLGFGVGVTLVLFPTGRLPGRVWLAPLGVLGIAAVLGGFVDLGSVVLGEMEMPTWVIMGAAAVIWCAAAPVVRFRNGSIQVRAQLRWLGLVAGVAGVAVVSAGVALVLGYRTPVGSLLMGGAGFVVMLVLLFGFPGAILIAILRYRLYEIDRLVSRSVTFTLVVVLVSSIYAAAAALVPRLFGDGSAVVTAGATLAAAAAFTPLRNRVRRVVDRRFNRSAYDAAREVDLLAGQLRDEVDSAAISSGLAAVAQRALQPQALSIWLASPAPASGFGTD